MQKKSLLLVLSLLMILTMFSMNAFADDFSDMPNDWSRPALEKAVENGLLKGDDGKIRPGESLKRAEMATVVNRAFNVSDKGSLSKFTDVRQEKWYYDEMAKAVQMGTFVGSGDKLYPEANISREEAFVVLARAFKISGNEESVLDGFLDKDNISDWAKNPVAGLVQAGYVAGSNGMINSKANITRAEFAQIMDNLVKVYISEAGVYTEDVIGNVMVNKKGVVLKGMTITGDLIIGDGVGKDEISLEDTVVTGRTLERDGESSIGLKVNPPEDLEVVFTNSPLSKEVIDRIMNVSYKENDQIKLDDLAYLQVSHWGFDDKGHIGEIIVNKRVGDQVLEIFRELYEAKYPIEKIRLIDEYNAIDDLSMLDNNSSAFCYREIAGSPGRLSNHSYGLAIDINPLQNPYVKNNVILPEAGKEFLDRSDIRKGMILEGDACYTAFKSKGWTWGGDWESLKDYQHFEFKLD